jgi:hypothetical protein
MAGGHLNILLDGFFLYIYVNFASTVRKYISTKIYHPRIKADVKI